MAWDIYGPHGPIGPQGPKGLNWRAIGWITATAYAVDDAITHGGQAYICTTAHTAGASTEPGVGASWTTVWQRFAEKGAAGTNGTNGTNGVVTNIQDEGVAVTTRGTWDFAGAGVTVTDNGAKNIITIPGGGGGGGGVWTGWHARRTESPTNPLPLSSNVGYYIPWNAEDLDTDAFHDNTTNPERFTIPTGKGGLYLVYFQIRLISWTTNQQYTLAVTKNADTVILPDYYILPTNAANYHVLRFGPRVISLVDGDYIRFRVTSGGNAGSIRTDGDQAVICWGQKIN